MSIAGFALRHPRGILAAALFLSLLGFVAMTHMPVAILPDFQFPRIAVIADVGDRAIPDVVIQVTRPLEQAVNAVPGVRLIRSKTARGSAELSVDFTWDTKMFEAFTRLNAAVASIRNTLPPETKLTVEWQNPSSFPVIGYSLTSSTLSPARLRELCQLEIAPALSRLRGVYRVLVQGGDIREYIIRVRPDLLAAKGVTIQDVQDALSETNMLQSVGRYEESGQKYLVVGDTQLRGAKDIEKVVVAVRQGTPIHLSDIGHVEESSRERLDVTTADGRPAALFTLLKQPGASTVIISEEVKRALSQMRSVLPEDLTIRCYYDDADLLRDSLGSLRDAILIGAILAMGVLIWFLGDLRSTAIVLLAIPCTVLITFVTLKVSRQTLNLMTLGGLAAGLGLVIDDLVVTLENIYRHRSLGLTARAAAHEGAREVQSPMIGYSFTTIAVFIPLAFVGGITGAFFTPLTLTFIILLILSVILAFTLVPILCGRLLRGAEGHKPKPPPRWLAWLSDRVYVPALRWCLDNRLFAILIALALAGLAGLAFTRLQTGFMPVMDEGEFVLDYLAAPGTSLEETDRQCRIIEEELARTPEVHSYSRRTGLELGLFITEPNRGDFAVRMKPRGQRKRSTVETMEDVRRRCQPRLPSMIIETIQLVSDVVGDISGQRNPIEIKVFGDDPQVLIRLGEQVRDILNEVPGAVEAVHGVVASGPEIHVRVDPDRAALAGLTPAQVIVAAQEAMLGEVRTVVRAGELLIGVRAFYPREQQNTLDKIKQIRLITATGRTIPLEAVATFERIPATYEQNRENQKPVAYASANLENRDLGSAMAEVRARMAREIKLPPGYTIEYGGLYESQQEAFRSLLTVLILGCLLVLVVTLYQYEAIAEVIALFLAAALSISGVIFALLLTHTPLNASSFTGMILVFGMVMRNGIVLMDYMRILERRGERLAAALEGAGRVRLRPILMTSVIAILTLLPIALGLGAGAQMQRPLAVAVIGGLAATPLFSLLLAPTVLTLFPGRRGRQARREAVG